MGGPVKIETWQLSTSDQHRPSKTLWRKLIVQSRISNQVLIAQTRTIVYWITTILIALELSAGGVGDILRVPYVHDLVVQHFGYLGYPAYFLVIIGVWKVPGAVALLVPQFPQLTEWAYAGAFFTYTGAAASHLAVGDGVALWWGPVVFAAIEAVS
jgi:DoxX-like family